MTFMLGHLYVVFTRAKILIQIFLVSKFCVEDTKVGACRFLKYNVYIIELFYIDPNGFSLDMVYCLSPQLKNNHKKYH